MAPVAGRETYAVTPRPSFRHNCDGEHDELSDTSCLLRWCYDTEIISRVRCNERSSTPLQSRPGSARHYLVAILRRGHLTRTAHRPMRPIRQPVQTLGFIAGQPPVQCLTRHPRLLCGLRHRQTVTDHRHHSWYRCSARSTPSCGECHRSAETTVTHPAETLSRISRRRNVTHQAR